MAKRSSPSDELTADAYFAVLPEWVLFAEISAQAVRLYATLRRHADKEDGRCHPGRTRLATLMHTSPSTVDRAVEELASIGAITVTPRRDPDNPKQQLSNEYRVRSLPPVGGVSAPAGDPPPVGGPPPPASDEETRVNEPEPVEPEDSDASGAEVAPMSPTMVEAWALANLLADLIEGNGSKRPSVTSAWVTAIDRMLRLDGRTPEQVENCIRWCQADEFWRANILSAPKLRQQYDRLRLAALQRRNGTARGQPTGVDAARVFIADQQGAL
jgi:hypothetical protein